MHRYLPTFFSSLIGLALSTAAVALPQAKNPHGVVVEEVGHGSAGEAAGIEPGDVLHEWSRAANPPANPEQARGRIESPFDLTDVEMEQAPRGEVELSWTRGGRAFSVPLPPGAWKIEARPQMPAAVLLIYQEGQTFVKANETDKAIELWRQLAQQARQEKNGRTASWSYFKAGNALVDVRKWDEAHAAYRAAIEETWSTPETWTQAQIWTADGEAFQAQNNFPEAESAYRNALGILQRRSSESLGVAKSLNDLGSAAVARGDLAAAEDFHRKALAIDEKLAPGSLAVAGCLTNVGNVADARGDLTTAEDSYSKALAIYEKLAPGSLDYAASLTRLGNVASIDLAAAEDSYRKALAIYEKLSPGSLGHADSLTTLGNVASARGDLAAAEDSHGKALAIYRKLAPGSLDYAASLTRLGIVADARGDPSAAENSYRKALAIDATGNLDDAASLTRLGIVANARGDLAAAEDCYRQALAIYEMLIPGSLDYAAILNKLGGVARSRGDLAVAEDAYRKAVAILEGLAPGRLEYATSLTGLGDVARCRADLAAAEDLHKKALAIREGLAPESLDYAASLASLGDVALSRRDLATAEDLHRKALAIREGRAPGSLDYAASLASLGDVALSRGDLATAEGLHRKALAIRERLAPGSLDYATSLARLGDVARSRGDPAAAKDFHTKALAIIQKLDPAGFAAARSLDNYLGNAASARSDPSAPSDFFTKALAFFEKLDPVGFFVVRRLHNYLGKVTSARSDPSAAEDFFRKALPIVEKCAPGSALEAQALHGAGVLHRKAGRRPEAAEAFGRAIAALELQKGKLGGSEEVKAGFAAQYADYYRDYIEVLLELYQPGEAFHVLERSRARSLLSMLAERDLVFAGDIPADLERERRLTDADYDRAQASIAKLDPQKDREQIDQLVAHLRELRDKQADVAQSVRKASPRLASLEYPQPLGLSGTQEDLDPGTVLLAYSVGKERSFLFAVQPGGLKAGLTVFTLSADEKALRESVDAFRNLIDWNVPSGQGASANLVARGRFLYNILIKPAEALIAKGDRILILPDGPLHTLPFGALVRDEKAGRPQYLIEWRPLHIAVSATVYAELKRSRREASSPPPVIIAAFGDPRYPMRSLKETAAKRNEGEGTPEETAATASEANEVLDPEIRLAVRGGYRFEPLPATRQEVESIASLYVPGAVKYLGEEATEEQAKSLGKDVPLIHFACHAYVNERFPLDSALVLTIPEKPRDGQDNGLLQAWEIFERVRIDADLVTLSACETGLGKETGGEGLVGLTRAFQYAGARSVLASLWKVEDRSTGNLMTRFYGYLRAGMTKDEALRQAQVDLIHSADLSPPYHWAAFQINGDWR